MPGGWSFFKFEPCHLLLEVERKTVTVSLTLAFLVHNVEEIWNYHFMQMNILLYFIILIYMRKKNYIAGEN